MSDRKSRTDPSHSPGGAPGDGRSPDQQRAFQRKLVRWLFDVAVLTIVQTVAVAQDQ